jgi:hypothetical protein
LRCGQVFHRAANKICGKAGEECTGRARRVTAGDHCFGVNDLGSLSIACPQGCPRKLWIVLRRGDKRYSHSFLLNLSGQVSAGAEVISVYFRYRYRFEGEPLEMPPGA